MTKTVRTRGRAVVELIDESPAAGGTARPPDRTSYSWPPETFAEFYRREYPRILVLARVLAGAPVAEDLAQEVMLAAYRRWPEIAEMRSPGGYVRGICVRQATSITRRLITERRALQRYAAHPSARMEPMTAEHEQLWEAVRRLPRRQAQAAALYYVLDLPVAEVAATLGCTEGTVKTHLSRARAALAEQLGEEEEEGETP